LRYLFFLALIFVLAVEILTRAVKSDFVSVLVNDERSLAYDYDPLLGWFPKKNAKKVYVGSRLIHVKHNQDGFRDVAYGPKTKPRILFLGDSFVWGYDAEKGERFTEKLGEKLPAFEILNFGVSGYGNDQEFLLLQKEFARFQPDWVFLIFTPNDRRDNSSNVAYGLGKPYFIQEQEKLTLEGAPVPQTAVYRLKKNWPLLKESVVMNLTLLFFEKIRQKKIPDPTEPIVSDMDSYLKERKIHLVVGFVDRDERLITHCQQEGIPTVDLSSVDAKFRFPSYGRHWTPEGHKRVSDLIYDFLRNKVETR